ncbi:hypothetical protein [Aquimarina addita]|uniref:hypothetical protein n=1 Tax=Aquimarina addita TaxID=870485 RepID=UPI0031EFFFEE
MNKRSFKRKRIVKKWFSFLLLFNTTIFCVSAQEFSCGSELNYYSSDTLGYVAEFSNGKKIGLYTYRTNYQGKETFYESEFSLYECADDQLFLSSYTASDNCRVNFRNDTLRIAELKRFAIGENWKLETVDYQTTYFFYIKDSLHKRTEITIPKFNIPQEKIDEFYCSIEHPLDNQRIEISEMMSILHTNMKKLEVLSIYGDEKAYELLKKNSIPPEGEEGLGGETLSGYVLAVRIINHIRTSSKNKNFKRFRL